MKVNSQARYWQVFGQIKRDALYINAYHGRVESIDRYINIFFAVTASGAVAGWAVWKQHEIVWASIVALSQVLTAAKAFLPFKTRMSSLSSLGPELDALALTAETDWFKVSRGLLTDQQAHDLTMSLKRKVQLVTAKFFRASSLPRSKGLFSRAQRDATSYMQNFNEEET